MQRVQKGRAHGPPLRLVVERLAGGGDGVAHAGGKTVFVPYSAPGDTVEADIVEDRRSFCRARLLRVVTPSPDRAEPRCAHFGVCGGCSWQHVVYSAQVAAKRAIVEDALRRIGRLAPPPVPPVIPSPVEYGYRHRARLHAVGAGGTVHVGFFRHGSHRIVPVECCPVLHPSLNAALAALARALRRSSQALSSGAEVRLDTGWDGSAVRLSFRGARGAAPPAHPSLARALQEAAAAADVALEVAEGDSLGLPLPLGPGDDAPVTTGATFTQVNLVQNQALVATALDLAAIRPGEEVLDLCCGLGNLAIPAARRGARVLGVDLDAQAVRQARENAGRAACDATFVRGDAAAVAAALAAGGRRFDLVLLNPPRTGARAACEALARLAPARVVVVSCDPATLARDAAALTAGGHRLAAAQPLDLFPQTAHVETAALFVRLP
jgi:23S rRNA (uracil1939-C5)-methyltransferase